MNTDKVQKLYNAILIADTVIIDDTPFLVVTDDTALNGQEDNEVIYFQWIEDDGQEYNVVITELGLSNATVNENRILLEDRDGIETSIALFNLTPFKINLS